MVFNLKAILVKKISNLTPTYHQLGMCHSLFGNFLLSLAICSNLYETNIFVETPGEVQFTCQPPFFAIIVNIGNAAATFVAWLG